VNNGEDGFCELRRCPRITEQTQRLDQGSTKRTSSEQEKIERGRSWILDGERREEPEVVPLLRYRIAQMMRRESVMRLTLRNLIVIFVILQGILTASVLYIAWRVKDIYDAIPGEPITVTIEPKKQ
jgi:hypothetical protein